MALPLLGLVGKDGRFTVDAGASVRAYRRIGQGYRFMHYSDAGLHGEDTFGADFHMVELGYRF